MPRKGKPEFAVRLPSQDRLGASLSLERAMTDAPDTQAPADNSTLCLDFKLFATWQLMLVAIPILALAHLFDDVPALLYYGVLLAILAAFVLAAIEHRRTHNWRWPGLDQDAVQRALIVAGGIFAFLLLASRAMPPFTRAGVPEIAFAFSMFAFACSTRRR